MICDVAEPCAYGYGVLTVLPRCLLGTPRVLQLLLCCRYDNLTVTVQHDTKGGGHFSTLAARGSPYMTFEFAAATPRIKSNGDVLKVPYACAREG